MPRWLAHAIVVSILAIALVVAFGRVDYEWNWAGVWEYRQKLLQGWLVTVGISLAALVTSTLFGGAAAALLRSGNVLLEAAGRVYVELIRGTPLLVQLLIGFYVVATAVGLENRFVAGVLLLSLFSGAYMAEIFRGGLDAIPKAQIDSSRAIGLTPWQSLRLVVLPQAVRLVLPAVAGQLAALGDRDFRAHAGRPGDQLLHLLHARKLPAPGGRLPPAHAAPLRPGPLAGAAVSLRDGLTPAAENNTARITHQWTARSEASNPRPASDAIRSRSDRTPG
jgi:polar amino acid transport system permease protein